MIRVLLVLFFLIITLQARENPFFPADGEKDMPYTSNNIKNFKSLPRSSIALPSSARVIKKVTIEYENLDASIETRSIKLNNSIDWHLPIFVSQNMAEKQPIESMLIEKTDKKQIKKVTKNIKVAKVTKKIKNKKYTKIASVKYVSFYAQEKSLKLITDDKLIRNFLLVEPHRIVLDFKRDSSLKSYTKKVPNSPFSKVRVGNHEGYYRTVIELDGQYRYKMKNISNGYTFQLR